MLLTVARIGRAHGLRGEVSLDLRTDEPAARLATGAVLATEPAERGPLTVARTREQQGRWYVTFAEAADRTAAESLRGVELVVEVAEDAATADDEDAWYPHELAGLRAEHVDGRVVGEILGLEHHPAHDVLVLREPDGARTLVPFVRAIVPVVDVAGGRVVLDPPGGLLAADAANLVVSEETSGGPGADAAERGGDDD
ncbi:ribosome maturation factor RimM [Cellulomonas pakistanensis]|uniref:Ribosome maturation factor RimM n=1 Tax=Cellulomonas pakistanensis TaxID=992287 RepID=A0A919PCT9_9CELL|nr:ribosome maturation factor RimM [Cellulomonas pakistanensis]GIG38121.1 ribosome maturation factor RimM [Cellulomonas pakistanensis]